MHPIIIGGGPAGCSAAIHLARAGARPILLEQHTQTADTICGGFLSWRTLERLTSMGLGVDQLGGQPITSLRIFSNDRSWAFPLPGTAMGLSRRRLDSLLLAKAQQEGTEIRTGARVTSAQPGQVTLADGTVLESEAIFLATGKQDVRGLNRPAAAAGDDPALGLRIRLSPTPGLAALIGDKIELHLFDGGYLGINLHEDGSANCCLAMRKSRFTAVGNKVDRLFAALALENPALAERLAASPPTGTFDAVGHVPYGWSTADTSPGLFRLGDQAGVIPSLAGEGIGLALASSTYAAYYWAMGDGDMAPAYQQAFAAHIRGPLRLAGILKSLAESGDKARWPLSVMERLPAVAKLLARQTRIS